MSTTPAPATPLHAVETIVNVIGTRIQRLTVPGGWLYMCFTREGVALQFVADTPVVTETPKEKV